MTSEELCCCIDRFLIFFNDFNKAKLLLLIKFSIKSLSQYQSGVMLYEWLNILLRHENCNTNLLIAIGKFIIT